MCIGSITLLFQRPSQPGLEILTNTSTTTTDETPDDRNPDTTPISTSKSKSSPQSAEHQRTWSPVPVIPPGYIPETSQPTSSSDTYGTQHQKQKQNETHPSSQPLPPILLNIGDLLSYWTNGLLRSTVHRVIFPHESSSYPSSAGNEKPDRAPLNGNDRHNVKGNNAPLGADRYSIAYFCHPTDSTTLDCIPSRLVPGATTNGTGTGIDHDTEAGENSGSGSSGRGLQVGYGGGADDGGKGGEKRKVLTAKEHLLRRLEATYGFKHV